MEIKGIWISLSIGATIGAIVFIYWIFSFDMSEMKKIALKRIEDDKKNLEYFKSDYKDNLLMNFDEDNTNLYFFLVLFCSFIRNFCYWNWNFFWR